MPDNKPIKASVKDRSLVKELGKGVMEEIIVPKSKSIMRDMFTSITNMFGDALKTSFDNFLYPDGNAPVRNNNNGTYTSNTNYTSYSRPIGSYQPSNQRQSENIGQRPGNEVKYIWCHTEEDAKRIIDELREDIENYGKAKVASLYEKLRDEKGNPIIKTTFADFKYGWTDPNSIGYYEDTSRRPGEDRWFLDLSRPVDITNVK